MADSIEASSIVDPNAVYTLGSSRGETTRLLRQADELLAANSRGQRRHLRYYQPNGDGYHHVKAMPAAASLDPDCLRFALDIRSVVKLPEEIFRSDPALADKGAKLATTAEGVAAPGPSRKQVVVMANA
jgi:hypothetical protein